MGNKVTFGLEKVHVAFKGVTQTETIEVLTAATTDGELIVAVTSAAVTGLPVSIVVPVATETHSTPTNVASTIVNAINNNVAVSAAFVAGNIGAVITLRAKVVTANDATLAISVTPGATGVTVGTSTNGVAGTTGWGVPIAIPGVVGFTPTPQGEESTFYADNVIYYSSTSNNGYTAELEMALVPDAVLVEMLGWEIDSNGMLVELADGIQKDFALLFQIEGDERNRRTVYYQCKASRPSKENKTKGEVVEPDTDKLSLVITPIEIESKKIVKGVLELSVTNAVVYDAFFTAVTLPAIV